jgi:predicted nuclease of predicted toxin-antitoxin system
VSERIRFHLDENVKSAVARELRRRSIDVTTTIEAGLLGQSDELQLAFICKQKRVIMTHDEDFLTIASLTSKHPGIAYCKQGTRSIGQIIEALVLIYEVYVPEEMVGRVEFL